MLGEASSSLDLIVVASVFVLVLAVWAMAVCLWSSRRFSLIQRLERRLGLGAPSDESGRVLRLWQDGKETTTRVAGERRSSHWRRLQELHRSTGWEQPIRTIGLGLVGIWLLVLVTGLAVTASLLISVGLSLVVPAGLWAYMQSRIKRRQSLLEGQFVEALELAARSLRAGHPMVGSFRLISEEMSPPVSLIFEEMCQLQEYGASLKDAIHESTANSGSNDLKLFATAVGIQLDSGGNLAEMMYRLAHVTRDRIRLRRRVSILTAQTQLSKRVLIVLPFLLLAGLTILNGEYMAPLFYTKTGHYLLVAAGTGMAVGIWMMNRVARLRY